MKMKSLIISVSAVAVIAVIGTTVLGANKLLAFANSTSEREIAATAPLTANQGENNDTSAYPQIVNLSAVTQTASVQTDIQEIKTELEAYGYPALTVQKGIPVQWVINADAKNLNSCNNEIIIPSLGISKQLQAGENVIEFTPAETGVIQYSCWMGMINSTIAVVDDINNYDKAEIESQIAQLPQGGGGCNMAGGLFGENKSGSGGGTGGCCGGR